uniref:Zf-CCHC domain-containing protein/UBN2 domain-containing protein n=1 Tax=Tanacetum cinerariifolium TaxID=118510 RepID=A0A6L2J5M2_TANCI|nr:zf-CCHC domain-containing protein/UBN2 domain-containing protein [Tanacetum cinerariifolium]
MEVEPLDQTKLEDVGLNNHSIPVSSRKVPSFDEPDPQPQPLPNYPSLDYIGRTKPAELAYNTVLEKDSKISKNEKEKYKSLALKARKVLSEEEVSSSDSEDEEYAMAVRDFKKFFRRRGKFVHQPHDDKKNFQKLKEDKKEKEDRSKENTKKEEVYRMAHDNNEVRLKVKLEPGEWIKDIGCSRHMTGNKDLFSSYKTIEGGDDILECELIENQEKDLEIKENEPLNKEIVNIKKTKDHPIDSVIGTGVETIVYTNSNHAGDYVDCKAQAMRAHSWDVASRHANPSPPRPSFDSIERLANEPPPLLAMEPHLPSLPQQLPKFP